MCSRIRERGWLQSVRCEHLSYTITTNRVRKGDSLMCGRYVIEGTTELSERFQLRQIPADLFPEWTTYNAAPTQLLPVIVEEESGERTALSMQWGLVPRWRRPDGKSGVAPINARAETLQEKPMFRGLTKARRCIVPANGFANSRITSPPTTASCGDWPGYTI